MAAVLPVYMIPSYSPDPVVEPITVDQLVKFGRIDRPDEVDLYGPMIAAARQQIELRTGISLTTQPWEIYYDETPTGDQGLGIPKTPLMGVTSVASFIGNAPSVVIPDDQWTMAYNAAGYSEVRMVPGFQWPIPAPGQRFLVLCTVGYDPGPPPTLPPPLLIQALYILAAHFATHGRDLVVAEAMLSVPYTFEDAIQPFVKVAVI